MLLKIKNSINKNPYFENENGIIYNADCLKILSQIPDNSIDFILTDPPYNIGDSNKLTKVGSQIKTNKES